MKLSRIYLVFFVALLVLSSSIYAQDPNSGSGFSENNDQSSNKVQIDFSDRRTYENLAPHLVANTLKKNLLTFNHSAVGANQPIKNIIQWPKHTALLKQFNLPPSFIEVVEILNDAQTKQKWLFDFKQPELTPVERSVDDQVFAIQSVLDLPEEPKFKLEIRNNPPVVFTTKKPASINTDQEDSYLESRYYLNGKPITEEKLEALIKDELNSAPRGKTVHVDDMTVGQYAQWLHDQDKPIENKPGSIIGVITNASSRSLTSFEEHVQKMGYKLSDLNFSNAEIDALKNENSTDPVKKDVWNGLVNVLKLKKLETENDPRADRFYRYLLFVHNNENSDEIGETTDGKGRLVKAFYHWALIDFETDLGNEKLPEFREFMQKAASREVMILGKKPNQSVGKYLKTISKIYSKIKEYVVQKAFERAWPIGQGEFFSNIEKLYERENRWWNRWYDKLFIKNKTSSDQSTNSGSKIRIQSTVTPDGIKIEHVQTTPTPENEIKRKNKQFVIDAKNGNEYAVREFFNDPDIKYETKVKALQEAISHDRTEIISVLALDESLNEVLLKEFDSLVSGYHSRTLRSKLKTIAALRDCLEPDQIQEVKRKHALMHEEVRTLLKSEPGINSTLLVKIMNVEIQNSYNIKPGYGFNGVGENGEFNLFDFLKGDERVVDGDSKVVVTLETPSRVSILKEVNRKREVLRKQKINRVLKDIGLNKNDISTSEYNFVNEYINSHALYPPESSRERGTYLHYACEHGFHPKIIRMLVDHGFSLNKMNVNGVSSFALWINSFQKTIQGNAERKEAFYKTLHYLRNQRKIVLNENLFPTTGSYAEYLAKKIPLRVDRKPILQELGIKDFNYTNEIIKLIHDSLKNYNVLDYEKIIKLIDSGSVDVFDAYFDRDGKETDISVLGKIIKIYENKRLYGVDQAEKNEVGKVILAAFEKNPNPEITPMRFSELQRIRKNDIGFEEEVNIDDGYELRKHDYSQRSEIFYHYIRLQPLEFLKNDLLLHSFIYVSRQMPKEHLEECIKKILEIDSKEEKERIFNTFSNVTESGRNTYNRTLVNQAVYAGVDVALLRKMHAAGADFTIQNDHFIAHKEVTKEHVQANPKNHHVDVVLNYAYRVKDKENARETLRFLINELHLVPNRLFKDKFVEIFTLELERLGFEVKEIKQLADHIIKVQSSNSGEKNTDLVKTHHEIDVAYQNQKTDIKIKLNSALVLQKLREESSKYTIEDIGQFVADIRNDPKKSPVWNDILQQLNIKSDDNFSEINDSKVKKFYQMGLYIHTHEKIGSEAKRVLVLEFWKEILKDFNGKIHEPRKLNDSFTLATSDEAGIYIFGEPEQVVGTKLATRFEKHTAEWKIGDLKQKYVDWLIDRPRDNVNLEKDFFYEIHHEKIGLPEKNEFLRILNDAGITLHDFFHSTSKMDHIFANWSIANDYQEIQEWNKLGSVKINSQKSFIKVQRENQDMSDWYGFSWACKKANIKPEDVFNGTEKIRKIYAYALISRALNKIQTWNASHSSEDQIVSLETLKKYGKEAGLSDVDLWRDMETSGWIQPSDILPMEQATIDHQNSFYRNLINRYQRFMVMSFGSAGPKLEYYIQQDNFEKFKDLFKHNGHLMSQTERVAILKAATEPGKGRYLDVIFDEMRFKLDVLPDVVKNKTSYMDSQVGLLLLQKATAQSIFLQKRELLKAVLARTDIDPNAKNNTNKTQLGIATSYFDPETVRLFLENPHTNPNLENGTGYIYTPLATSITPADVSHDGEVTNIGIYADEYNRDIYRNKSAIFENNKNQYRLKVVQLLYDDPRIIMDQQHSGPLVMQEKIGWLLSKNQDPGIANIFKNPPAWQVRGVDIGSVLERMQKWNAARYGLSRAVIAEQGEIGKSLSESVLEIFPDLSKTQRDVLVAKYAEHNYFKIPTFDYSKSIERLWSDINGTNNGYLKAPILIEKKWLVYANRINRYYDQFQALMHGNVGVGTHNKTFSSYQKESTQSELAKVDTELSLAEAHKKLIEESQKYTDEQIKEFLFENAKNPKKTKYWKDLLTQLKILEKTGFWSRFAKSENPDPVKIYDESLGKINDPKVRKFYQWGLYVHEHGETGSKTKEHLVEAFFKEFLTDYDSQISNKTLVKAIFKKTLEKEVAIYGKVVPMDEFSPRFKAEHPEIAAAFEDYRKQTQLPLKQEIWDAEKLSRIDIVKDEAVASTADFIEEELPPVVEKNHGVYRAPAMPLEKYEQMISEWNDQHPTKKIYTPEDMQEYLGHTDAHIKTSFYDACQKRNISPGRYFVLNLIRRAHPEYQLDLSQSIAWLNEEIDLYKATKHSTNIISNSQLLFEWLAPRFQYRHENGVINPVITNEDITNTFIKYVKPEHQESSMHLKILLTIEDLMKEIKTSVRENPYSWAEVTQYVREIKENTVNKDSWNNLLHTLQIDQDASHSLSMLADIYGYTHQDLENEFQIYQRLTKMDQRRWEFYQYALYVHRHAEVGTQEKYRLVAAFRKILEAEYPYIVATEEFRKVFKQATDNKIFGEKKESSLNIAKLIAPITTKSQVDEIIQKLDRWNTSYPKRKIDTNRAWNKYHDLAELPDFDESEKILSEKNMTMANLGVTKKIRYPASKMSIQSELELRTLILNHNQQHPEEKVSVQDDYVKISGKNGYPSVGKLINDLGIIDWAYVTGRTETRSENLRTRPTKIVIRTPDQFRDLILNHNQTHLDEQIFSKEDYMRLREKYGYMWVTAIEKHTGPTDWDYVTGKTSELRKESTARGDYSKIAIVEEKTLRELILNHNRFYPKKLITDKKSYEKIATKFKYPSIRTLDYNLASIDWEYVTGKTENSSNKPRLKYTEIRNIRTEAALREIVLKHNLDYPTDQIHRRQDYKDIASKYGYPSIHTVELNIGAIDWKYITGKTDKPEPSVYNNRTYRKGNSGNVYSTVIPFMGYFMPGGVVHRMIIATKMVMDDLTDHFKRWIETIHIPDFSKMTQVLSASKNVKPVQDKLLSESSVTQKDADALTVSESSPGEPQVSGDGSSSDPENEEKKMKEVVEEAYSIIHKTGKNPPRTWTLNQVKERIDQYNAEVEDYNATAPKNLQRQKIDGIKKLDPLSSVTGLPSRSKIQDLLDHNSKDRYWLFGKVPSDYDLKNEIATYKKLTGKSPIVYRGMIWTAKKLKNDLDAYNEKAPEDQKITGIKMFDKFALPAGLPDRKMVLPILDNDGQNTDWLFGDDNYDVNSEIIKFKLANPGKEPVVWRGKLWTAAILRQLVAEYNLYALESDKITDWKSWDRFYSKAKLPDRSKAIQVLDIENADHHWMFSRVEETYNLAEEISKFKAANPGVEPIIFKGKLWTAKLMKESVDQYNKTASGSDQLTNQKLLDKLAAKAKVPYRDIYRELVKQNVLLSPKYQLTENMWKYKTNRQQENTGSKQEPTGKSGNLYTIALPIPPSLFAPNGWLARTFTGVTRKISDTYHSFVTTEQKSRIKTPVGQMSPEQELGGIIADLKGQDGGSELPPEDKKRIEELTKQLRDQGPSFRKRMIEQVAGAATELPKSFGNFFASLTLAHLWETTNDHSIGSDTFIDIIKGLPTEFLHFTTFSAGASVGSSVAQVGFGVKDMLVEKLLQQQGPQAIKEVESIKGVRQTLIGMTTTRAYVKGQLGMLAGTILNLMIYNKEMTTNEMLLSAFQSQLSFMVAGALVRGVVVRVGVTVGEQLLARGFTILKWAYKGSKCTGIVGIVVLAAEFVVADPINRWFNKIQKNSETIAAAYENIFRLDAWLQNKAIPVMRYQDICATESDELKRGACYAQGAISGLQMYATQMSYWPVNAVTMKFQEKQVKVDQKYGSLSQLSESDRDETEWGHGVPIKEGPIGQSEYINENKNIWSEYIPAADKTYKEVREEINSDYQNAFAQLQAGLKQCDDQSLEKCGTEIQKDSAEHQKLLQNLINQLDEQERLRNWDWWYENRTTKVLGIKPFAIDFEVYNLNEWADQSLYALKRLAQLNIADKNKFMIQQYFVSQLVTMVGNEFLYGSPVIRTVAQNNQRNNEGELLHSFWKDARGYGQWWRIFELMYNPKASFATSGGTLQGARERENISRDFELAKKYSYGLFSKNTLTLIAPRGIEKYGNRKEKLLMDLGHYYACTWSKKVRKDFVSSYLNDSRSFEKSEGYLAQQDKYFKQQNDQMKNAKYRLPTDEEWDNYMADQEKEYVAKVPMMFIQVYDQVENVDRFSPEPLIQFKEVVGVTSEMLAQYGSYTTCN